MAMEAPWLQELLATTSIFSESEIAEMENLFRQVRKEALTQEFYQDLATSFSSSTCRIGKPSISWQQVHNWFQDKQKGTFSVMNTPMSTLSSKAPETSMVLKGGTASEIADLAFEAKSSRDNAWYDVGTFLNYRVLSSGELEACVRFAGFGVSHDEWVNVKIGVRERSIPLEHSECHKIKVGDLVLCYQVPGLAVVIVGNRKDSQSYVNMKRKACAEVGIKSFDIDLPEQVSEPELIAKVHELNANPEVHGILVQLPLPKHINEENVLSEISIDKDVDGFHPLNIGKLAMKGRDPLFQPCTPKGCLELLSRSGISIKGKKAVVVGRSNIVGLPVSLLLLKADATISIVHSRTTDPESIIREADIVIAAAGQAMMERLDYAVYVDAHVMEIQRMLHDIKGCRCIFVVRFDDDKTEEKVQLNKICCRPK